MTLYRVEVIKYTRQVAVAFVEAPPGILTEDDGEVFEKEYLLWGPAECTDIPTYCEIEKVQGELPNIRAEFSAARTSDGKLELLSLD